MSDIDLDDVQEIGGITIIPGVNDLPLFAGKDQIRIHNENLRNEGEIEKTCASIDEMKNRVKVMKEHFANVQQEVDHTNTLQGAKAAEIHTETHLKQLTSRALGRSQFESKKVQNEISSVQEQLNTVQSLIYKANEMMDEFKMQMNWNQEELEQWSLAAQQKDEDLLAIEKYKRADEFKIKELTLQLEHLTKNYLIHEGKLENEATETQAKQMELDRIAQEFKTAHLERQALVNRWQDLISDMKNRDKAINDLGERFASAKAERNRKELQTNLQRKRLTAQNGENKEVETRSENLSRIVLRKREEMGTRNLELIAFRGELESLKNELTTAAENMATNRADNNFKSQQVEDKKVQLERERQRYQVVKGKIAVAENNTTKAEMTAKQAEDELAQRERDLNALIAQVKQLKEKAIRENQVVFDLKHGENNLRNEISGLRSISRNLESQLNQLDKESARQQELLYNAEFQIQQNERKLARGMGERSDEEKVQLRKQIEVQEHILEGVKEKKKMLQQQIRRLQNELVAVRMHQEELNQRFSKLTESLGEKELENKMMEEEIRRDTKDLEEKSVANDLLRLEVKRLKDLLSAKSDAVYSLENRKAQLLLSLEERKQEISVTTDLLKAEFKALNDDRHNITMELRNRQANVNLLKSRFEAVAREADSQHSQAYYIIQAAQKREELQRRGDSLDQDVRRCEHEIRQLRMCLDHLNARNVAIRESFQKVDLKGNDAEILQQLDERTKLNKDALFRKKKELQRLIVDFEEDARRLEQVRAQNEKQILSLDQLRNAKAQVENELIAHQNQMDELLQRMDKIAQKHRKKCIDGGVDPNTVQNGTLEEKAVKSEVLKDVVQNVLYTLGQLAVEFPEVSEALNARLTEADLRLPSEPPAKVKVAAAGASTKNPSSRGRNSTGGPRSVSSLNGGGSIASGGSSVQQRTFDVQF